MACPAPPLPRPRPLRPPRPPLAPPRGVLPAEAPPRGVLPPRPRGVLPPRGVPPRPRFAGRSSPASASSSGRFVFTRSDVVSARFPSGSSSSSEPPLAFSSSPAWASPASETGTPRQRVSDAECLMPIHLQSYKHEAVLKTAASMCGNRRSYAACVAELDPVAQCAEHVAVCRLTRALASPEGDAKAQLRARSVRTACFHLLGSSRRPRFIDCGRFDGPRRSPCRTGLRIVGLRRLCRLPAGAKCAITNAWLSRVRVRH